MSSSQQLRSSTLGTRKAWWREHRIYTELFATEPEPALRIMTVLPGAGTPYPEPEVVGLRRLYLRKIGCDVYYTFDEHEVIVRAVWGARRRRGPQIKRGG